MIKKFTTPKVSTANPKDWYVWFRYEGKPIKVREGMNYIKDLGEKKLFSQALIKARTLWLEQGWNPVKDPEFKLRNVHTNDFEGMLFGEAMDYALKSKVKHLKPTSLTSYTNVFNRIMKVAEGMHHHLIPVSQYRRSNVLELLDSCRSVYSLSNHAYNKYKDLIRAMFTVLEDCEAIDRHPAQRVKDLNVPESNKYQSYTNEEKAAIYKHIRVHCPNLLPYVQMVYYTGMRPLELLALRIKDINLDANTITIAPDLSQGNSKTSKIRYIPINRNLAPILSAMNLNQFPEDYYIFGSCYGPEGNRSGPKASKNGALHPNFLKPSPRRIKRDTITKLWNKLIKQDLGLDKYLYALKHTGADDMIMADIPTTSLQHMYGHNSRFTTEIYITRLKEKNKQTIVDQAPAFLNER